MRSSDQPELLQLRGQSRKLVDRGASFSGSERNRFFVNHAGNTFSDLSGLSGIDHPGDTRTHVRLDFDRDGFSDIALINANAPQLCLYRNNLGDAPTANQFLAIRLNGGNHRARPSSKWSTRDGIGTIVHVTTGVQRVVREFRAGEGFAGQNSRTMIVGLGAEVRADIEVAWPSGVTQEIDDVPAGSLITIHENATKLNGEFYTLAAYTPLGRPLHSDVVDSTKHLPWRPDPNADLSVYLTFATWCRSCVSELPRLQELASKLAPKTIQLFGVPIDPDDTSDKLERWKRRYKPPLRLVADLSVEQRADVEFLLRAHDVGVQTYPSTIVTDPQGTVRAVFPGPPTLSQIRELLDRCK